MEADEHTAVALNAPAEVPDIAPLRGCSRGALVIRHGPRTGGDFALTTDDLTEAGEIAARRLGERIGNGMPIRFFSSPINRCVHTAKLIAEGAGVEAKISISRMLGKPGPFPLDEKVVDRYLIERSLQQFAADWVDGKLPITTIAPISHGAEGLMALVKEQLRVGHRGLDIYVGHDLFLTPVPIHYLGYDVKAKGLLGFLDGFTVVMEEGTPVLTYGGRSIRV